MVFVTEQRRRVTSSARPTTATTSRCAWRPAPTSTTLIETVEHELQPYGVVDSVPRAEQPGYDGLKSELDQNRVMARSLPVLVLLISSMSLFIALSRLVTAQRGEIGLAKALGYSDSQILLHYLTFALVIAGGGIVLGVALGLLGARGVALSYTSILGIPFLESGIYPRRAARGRRDRRGVVRRRRARAGAQLGAARSGHRHARRPQQVAIRRADTR